MPIPEPLLAILPPVAGAAVAVAAGRQLTPAPAAGQEPARGWAVAGSLPLAAGAALAAGLLFGWHAAPPADVNAWPLWLAAVAAVVALAANARWRWFIPLAVAHIALATPLLLRISLRDWSAAQAALWLPALALPWLAQVLATRAAAARLPSAALAAWAGTLAVAGYVIADPVGSAFHGLLAAGIGAAAGCAALGAALWGGRIAPAAIAVAVAALAPVWWLLAHSLAWRGELQLLPAPALIPLILAPSAAWAAWPLRRRPWLAGIAAAVLAGLVAASTLLLLPPAPPPDPSGW